MRFACSLEHRGTPAAEGGKRKGQRCPSEKDVLRPEVSGGLWQWNYRSSGKGNGGMPWPGRLRYAQHDSNGQRALRLRSGQTPACPPYSDGRRAWERPPYRTATAGFFASLRMTSMPVGGSGVDGPEHRTGAGDRGSALGVGSEEVRR